MTTKPKARKFRIRRSAEPAATSADPQQDPLRLRLAASDASAAAVLERRARMQSSGDAPSAKPAADAPKPGRTAPEPSAKQDRTEAAASQPDAPKTARPDLDMEQIRQEGLTGRQLRMARRVAQKHGMNPTSDFDAVRLLRMRGIDPFQRSNMLELVVPRDPEGREQASGAEPKADTIQLPQTVPQGGETLPSTELSPIERRNRQISDIQRDITRRRRRKVALLCARLAFFVFLPTFAAGWYFYKIATPMFATKSEFVILQADNQGGTGLGGLLSGTQFATSQDSIVVQSYLLSKDAMLRLDEDEGFTAHFSQEAIDPIQRLEPDPSTEQAYGVYEKNVKVGYDPTEGVLRMEVIAADPVVSAQFSEALLSYAEQRVNDLSQQKRGDQMADAEASFAKAEAERRAAQEELVNLQLEGATLDPEAVIAGLRSQINSIELQLQEKELQLSALLDNARPNQSRVDGARADVRRLNEMLEQLNAKMTDVSQGENSLAQLSVRIQMAQADLATRDMMLQSALQQMEQTRMEANRQVRYLTTSVRPVPPEEATYPRKFENTLLAFLVFAGVYLMISLTASILREQVTS
ncbi:capsule biosynthesis protein [Sulfitobacter sp. D35]|uniref:capsule biosynthesis protein n=1 Tax=Sulfitobacter sp. D35 TaxID=3083252 RepID=UPI00296E2883|nr:capsule biosynthesis protein [Sulfitobacter sp. D35]MDW4499107.1 capsule biosynthesis protein [Sulfitobacter sp. D35]